MIHYIGLCVRYVFLLLLCLITVSFVLSNDQTVHLSLFPLPYEVSLQLFALSGLVLLLGLVSGMLAAHIHTARKIMHLRRELRDKSKRLQALYHEASALQMERQAQQNYAFSDTPKLQAHGASAHP
ncbi:MAG: hypothetical protein K2Q12_02205 [Rickettsiales bacterium]|nr:hypothetical protein [Rickettsiales bacterium]